MPIAAVPAYLGQDFSQASPGLRFGLYLPIWTERADQEQDVKKRSEARSNEGSEVESMLRRSGMDATIRQLQQRTQKPLAGLWEKNDFAAKDAWQRITALDKRDKATIAALFTRQQAAFAVAGSTDARLCLEAISTAPFSTGLGNEHPLENGFAFLNPYGLPYLAGSGVKGVLRQAARELASGDWGEQQGWSNEKTLTLTTTSKQRIALSTLDALFGLESGDGDQQHVRGALTFWDVIPRILGDNLAVEVMTLHQGHYYQQKRDRNAGDSSSPHDSGQPVPINFLTVPPGSGFAFHVTCDLAHLQRLAPSLTANAHWKTLLTAAFEHAFQWLGFGAKTAVGYGAMQSEGQRQQQAAQAEARKAQEKQQQAQAAAQRQAETAVAWTGAQVKFNRANGSLSVKKDGREAVAIKPKGQELLDSLPPNIRQKVAGNQFVRVTAYVAEGVLVRIEAE